MKYSKLFLISFAFVCGLNVNAQKTTDKTTAQKTPAVACNANVHLNKCVESLKPSGYRFLKSYKLEGKASILEYEYTFSKGTTYFISMVSADPDSKLKVSLYDVEGRMVASSHNPDIKKFYPSLEMRVQRSGVYKIKFSQEANKDYCAASVLGFKR
jgi:hypothetical protein